MENIFFFKKKYNKNKNTKEKKPLKKTGGIMPKQIWTIVIRI